MKKLCLTFFAIIALAQFSFAQWTVNGNNIYVTTPPNVIIGNPTSETIDTSSAVLFPGAVPKMEILTGASTNPFTELVTIRHAALGTATGPRQLGFLLKLSNETTTTESGKMGGMLLESSNNYSNTPSLSLLTNNTRQLTILSTGNIGIGTMGPTASLSITPGASGIINEASAFLAGTPRILGTTTGSYLYPFEFRYHSTANADRLQIAPYRRTAGSTWSGTGYRIQFAIDSSYTNGSKAFIEIGGSDPTVNYGGFVSIGTGGVDRLSVLNNGNVLIGQLGSNGQPGQINSAYKLDVNGSVRANGIVVNITGADFVFEPTYKLASLTTVKQYIDINHHLPEIASAKEMQKGGLDLGQNQIKLLQKVEELTLYLIEKDKQLTDEKEKNTKQQQQIDYQEERIKKLEDAIKQLKK